MASIDLHEWAAAGSEQPVTRAGLRRLWTTFNRKRAERRDIVELSRLESRLLRDMGIEPNDIDDALHRRRLSSLVHPLRRTGRD